MAKRRGQGGSNGYNDYLNFFEDEFFEEWADNFDRFIKRLIPVPRVVRTQLLGEACRKFAVCASKLNIRPPNAACLSDPNHRPEVVTFLRHLLKMVQGEVVEHWGSLLPVPSIESGGRGQRWRQNWPELSEESRVTLAYWLGPDFWEATGLCLDHELEMDRDTLLYLTDRPSPGALDVLLTRARIAFGEQYKRLQEMNSPPFPELFLEILDDQGDGPPWPREKQRLLIATVDWLQQQLLDEGTN